MDDVLVNKTAIIERCLGRIAEEYVGNEDKIETDFTRQDSIILNLQRACEAAIDMGNHLIRLNGLGIPQSSRDTFSLLSRAGVIPEELSKKLQRMVGFRNIAVHDYQNLSIDILRSVLDHHLKDFDRFCRHLLNH